MAKKVSNFQKVLDAANDVIVSEDDAGCVGGLTVTSKAAIKKLDKVVEAYKKDGDDRDREIQKLKRLLTTAFDKACNENNDQAWIDELDEAIQ